MSCSRVLLSGPAVSFRTLPSGRAASFRTLPSGRTVSSRAASSHAARAPCASGAAAAACLPGFQFLHFLYQNRGHRAADQHHDQNICHHKIRLSFLSIPSRVQTVCQMPRRAFLLYAGRRKKSIILRMIFILCRHRFRQFHAGRPPAAGPHGNTSGPSLTGRPMPISHI